MRRIPRIMAAAVALGGAVLAAPAPAAAQLGAVEALLRNATDLSFYFNMGDLAPGQDGLRTGDWGLAGFGVELLFVIGTVRAQPAAGAAAVASSDETREWKEMRIVRSESGLDTTYIYADDPAQRPVLWSFELGVGYGQITGFEASTPGLDLRGAVRDLPAVSLYANYEPAGVYLGLRSGFMRTQALQVYADDGTTTAGSAESFLAGAVAGKAFGLGSLTLFVEGAYALRHFPSVQWSPDGPLAPEIPRSLTLSGWSIGTGIQFGIGTR